MCQKLSAICHLYRATSHKFRISGVGLLTNGCFATYSISCRKYLTFISNTIFKWLGGLVRVAVQLLRWQLHQYYSLHMKLQCESNIAKAVHSRSLMSCLMSSSLSFGFLDEIASPKSVSQSVMLSDFGDSYRIYRARKLVKVMLTPNINYLF